VLSPFSSFPDFLSIPMLLNLIREFRFSDSHVTTSVILELLIG